MSLPIDLQKIGPHLKKYCLFGGAICASIAMLLYILVVDRLDAAFAVQMPFGFLFIIAVLLIYFLAIVLLIFVFDLINEKSEEGNFEPITKLFFLLFLLLLCFSYAAIGSMAYTLAVV